MNVNILTIIIIFHVFICCIFSQKLDTISIVHQIDPKRINVLVFISHGALYSIVFIDNILSRSLEIFNPSYVYETVSNINQEYDLVVISPNDFPGLGSSADSQYDEWSLYRQNNLFDSIVSKLRTEVVIMISGEALDFSIFLDYKRETGEPLINIFIVATNDLRLVPSYIKNFESLEQISSSSSDSNRNLPILDKLKLIKKVVYAPVATLMFYELYQGKAENCRIYNHMHLLLPRGEKWALEQLAKKEPDKQIAYLYRRCTGGTIFITHYTDWNMPMRELREKFYTLLKAKIKNTASLGFCCGHNNCINQSPNSESARYKNTYLYDAINMYESFKFVVAFENSDYEGYITEKLILPFLAGAVPIYLGPVDASKYFNPKAYINCRDHISLEACIDYVYYVNDNFTLYLEILSEQPITGKKFNDFFYPNF